MPAEFYINTMVSTIHTVDSEVLLSPELTRRLMAAMMDELDRKDILAARRESDRRLEQGAQRSRAEGLGLA